MRTIEHLRTIECPKCKYCNCLEVKGYIEYEFKLKCRICKTTIYAPLIVDVDNWEVYTEHRKNNITVKTFNTTDKTVKNKRSDKRWNQA